MTTPFQGYTAQQACALLGFHNRQAFWQSGLAERIHRTYPFGSKFLPLYATGEVDDWALHLRRRRALIALGRRHANTPILDAPTSDEWDSDCPRCGRWAFGDPGTHEEYAAAIADGSWPLRVWCERCGIVFSALIEED